MASYAVFETGSKQYRVQEGDLIDVELVDAAEDGKIIFENVLLVSNDSGVVCGSPNVKGAVVTAELVDEVRGPKVHAFTYRKRKHSARIVGHRQNHSRVRITSVAVA